MPEEVKRPGWLDEWLDYPYEALCVEDARQICWYAISLERKITQLTTIHERQYSDAMVAHRWFASRYGEQMNGRDFAVKCAMADDAEISLRAQAEALAGALEQCELFCGLRKFMDLGGLDEAEIEESAENMRNDARQIHAVIVEALAAYHAGKPTQP